MAVISTSLFDIFKIGPGPSSSHTIGPMLAAARFLRAADELPLELQRLVADLHVHLYGSLSSTGKGHGTDRAILAGLLGQTPENCQPEFINTLLQEASQSWEVKIAAASIAFGADNFHFEKSSDDLLWANTLRFDLYDQDNALLLSRTYYSVGGGFILCDGESEPTKSPPPYPYGNFQEFCQQVDESGLSASEILLRNEQAISGLSRNEILSRIDHLIDLMEQAVERGLSAHGLLPGWIKLERKAAELFERAEGLSDPLDRSLLLLSAFAMAAAEENAAGQIVVTAPTSGASGVLPGILHLLAHYQGFNRETLCQGMLLAGLIAFVARHNASISGAEVGCQGEIGVASAMAAALLAQVKGKSLKVIENAAESALEHHLGLTCDPIGGYVQIPCIERNGVGAVTAYNAFLLAAKGNPNKHKLRFDAVIKVMLETGRDMSPMYKETACGGLAVNGLPQEQAEQ